MATALQQMAGARPKQLQTLPADGVILEELIEDLRQEYGFPTTPQEYRLLIKVPGPEAEPSATTEAIPEEAESPARSSGPNESGGPSPRPRRRRRRGRRSGGASTVETAGSVVDESPGADDVEHVSGFGEGPGAGEDE